MSTVKNVIGYIRVSTAGQADEGVSLQAQREAIQRYAGLQGLNLVEIVEEAGVSGHKLLERRPGGKRVLQAIRGREVAGVLVYKLDRAFRNTGDCLARVEAWERRGVSLHLLDMGGQAVDTSTAVGKLMLTMLAAVAEMERNLTAERTRAAMAHKRSKGERTGGLVPFGFEVATNGTALVPVESEQAVIREVVELREAGESLTAIARALNGRGVKTKTGKSWYPQTVKNILHTAETRCGGSAA